MSKEMTPKEALRRISSFISFCCYEYFDKELEKDWKKDIEAITQALDRLELLEKENQELQAKVYELDTVKLAIQNGLFKATIQENEKYKKFITWLKNTFEITLDSKVRISDGTDCIQAFPIDLKTNEVIYDLLKEVLE